MRFKSFRKLKVPMDARKQYLLYYTCVCYDLLDPITQTKIQTLCNEVGGNEYSSALFAFLKGDASEPSLHKVAMEYYVSERKLQSLRTEFFRRWSW